MKNREAIQPRLPLWRQHQRMMKSGLMLLENAMKSLCRGSQAAGQSKDRFDLAVVVVGTSLSTFGPFFDFQRSAAAASEDSLQIMMAILLI